MEIVEWTRIQENGRKEWKKRSKNGRNGMEWNGRRNGWTPTSGNGMTKDGVTVAKEIESKMHLKIWCQMVKEGFKTGEIMPPTTTTVLLPFWQ